MEAALYLIPVTLGDTPLDRVLPPYNAEVVRGIRHFIVEDVRSARRFLKQVDRSIDIDALTFYPMGKHADEAAFARYLAPLRAGEPVGVISEAGCPAVADPGAQMVALARREGLPVVALVGPSSILLSVMASGFNGQSFAFHGYLPIELADVLAACRPQTQLCIAAGLTTDAEWVRSMTVGEWRRAAVPDLSKTPAIFLLYRPR